MTDTGPAQGDRRRWAAFIVALVAAFMTLLDVSIVNVAIPSIQTALRASPSELQWVLSGYALAFGLVLVPAGRFGDARGRRGVFVTGLALFTATSAAAGLAGSPTALVIARLAQGAAAGLVNPQVTGLIQQLFQGRRRARPFGMLGATIGVSTAIGPLLGGVLIHLAGAADGWRWVFYVNVPVGLVAIVLAWHLVPSRPEPTARRRGLDPVGVLLLGFGVLLVLLPLVQHEQWPGAWKWALIPVGAGAFAAFVWWERRRGHHHEPVFDITLFRLRSYALGSLVALLYFAGFTAVFFVFTLYLQSGLGFDALAAGLALTPFAIGSVAGAAIGGRLVSRAGRPLVAGGLILVAAGLAAVSVVLTSGTGRGAIPVIAGALTLAGLGSGLVITPNQTLTLAEVPVTQAGSAAGMLQTWQRIGSALGIAGVGTVFFSTLVGAGWSAAFRSALLVTIGFVVFALLAALADSHPNGTGRRRAGAGT